MPSSLMGPPAPPVSLASIASQEQDFVQQGQAAGSVTRNLTEIPFSLGGLVFPVPPRAMQVKQAIKIDEVKIPKKSGSIRQPTGYESTEITVDLELVPEESLDGTLITTPLDRLRPLQKLFRDGRASLPKPVEIISPLTDLFGIRQVLIQELAADEDGESNWIPVHLVLVEFESIKTQLEHQAASAGASDDAAAQGAEAIEGDENLDRNLGYVRDQFNDGLAEGSGEAPGDDMDDPGYEDGD
jgi:hypothetical protein